MRDSDKFRSDLDAWESEVRDTPDSKSLERLRRLFYKDLTSLPENLLSDVFVDFLERWGSGSREGRQAALRWLSGAAALFSGDYEQAEFTHEDWVSIREAVSANADQMPLDLLTEILSRVLEARAIS
jgi:hypothetical protein